VKTLSDAYAKAGNIEKASAFRSEYEILVDSFKLLENQKQELLAARNSLINSTENKILLLEKDRELNEKTIQLLQEQQATKNEAIKRQKTITYFLLFGFVIILVMAFFIYRNNKQKQQSNQLLTLKSLRNQMNPHFIFNSLNSVNTFIASKDERSANKYLADFSKLMREVLEYSQNDFIPLSKEIAILELYIGLEHYRFKEVFDYTVEIDPSIDIEQYQIPPMLLQPFIENAIWHGLRYRKSKGRLTIRFTNQSNHVLIVIQDDGIGRTESKALKTENQKKMKSTGLKNVEDRLSLIQDIFKKKLNIQITDSNKDGSGTTVKIELYT
jgi:two-component system LytT family sensor kinase